MKSSSQENLNTWGTLCETRQQIRRLKFSKGKFMATKDQVEWEHHDLKTKGHTTTKLFDAAVNKAIIFKIIYVDF